MSDTIKREIHIHIHTSNGAVESQSFDNGAVNKVLDSQPGEESLADMLKYLMINSRLPGKITEDNLASLKLMYYMLGSAFGQQRSNQESVKITDEDIRKAFKGSK